LLEDLALAEEENNALLFQMDTLITCRDTNAIQKQSKLYGDTSDDDDNYHHHHHFCDFRNKMKQCDTNNE
jgi:hypothetical protein